MRNTLLSGKKILVGVTGSIAIYKTLELIRQLVKASGDVKVVMSEDAKRFISPLTFETISQNKVLHVDTESWSEELSHIHIGKWADMFIIAPASVNTINKLSCGIADNLLTQTAIAFTKPILLAPSANTHMMLNPITQESLKRLQNFGYVIVAPESKLLACNDEGVGALASVEEIFYAAARVLLKEPFWEGRDVIITGGGTREKIDDVRCLSNFSSGKQALALATVAYLKGANVTLITGGEAPEFKAISTLHVTSSNELRTTLEAHMRLCQNAEKTPYLFMTAAISDYVPEHVHHGKLKKETLGESYCLALKRNVDILSELDKTGWIVVGFKAETDEENALQNAQTMLEKKGLSGVCLNIVKEQNRFGSNQNEVYFIGLDAIVHLPLRSKFEIAEQIITLSQTL